MNYLEIRWKNYHSFVDTQWIRIKPLTIVIGANNSGKTSIHSPLLILKQSILAKDQTVALKTKGDLINAGSFNDLVYRHENERKITFSFRLSKKLKMTKVRTLKPVGEYPPGSCSFTYWIGDNPKQLDLIKFEVLDVYGRSFLTRSYLKSGKYSLRGLEHFSTGIKNAKSEKKRHYYKRILSIIKNDKPENIFFSPESLLKNFISLSIELKEKGFNLPKFATEYFSIIIYISSFIKKLLNGISYIGPLRRSPERQYEISGESPQNVGMRGEYAPEIIFRSRDKKAEAKVKVWLERFGFGTEFKCEAIGSNSFELLISRIKEAPQINFADTGFGVSQILPLIVQGLYSEKGSFMIAEQPEIHLNPKQQAELANLFCEVANSDRSVYIETHSEHLLLRVRRLVAEKKISAKDVALYFVEKKGDSSKVREVSILENGHILPSEWPKDFFGDALRDSLALANAQTRSIDSAK